MNLRALAATDPDTPQRQRNCGAVPIGDQVEIRVKDGSAYCCGLATCGNVWLCPVCHAKSRPPLPEEAMINLTNITGIMPKSARLTRTRSRHS